MRPETDQAKWALETIYFGGGTPSRLSSDTIDELLTMLSSRLGGGDRIREVTLEANPEDVSVAAARSWVESGVTRVSLGVQSLGPATLEWMHRSHRAADTVAALRRLAAAGVPDISVDVIFGLPEFLDADPIHDVRRLLALEPAHISVYGLTVEPGTALFKWRARGRPSEADESRYAEEFLQIHDVLTDAGYEHYEVSNYARPGKRSRHNSAYWSRAAYVGLGPSAHSYADGVRTWNIRDWGAYRHALDEGRVPIAGHERLEPEERRLEDLYLGLRTAEGVSLAEAGPFCAETLSRVQGAGWLVVDNERLCATPEGWLRLDELLVALTTSADGG